MAETETETSSDLSLMTQLRSFTGIYWVSNWMELVERFAYYGVRVVLPVFMVAALDAGGPQFDHIQKGKVYAVWALVQSLLPIFTGGFADVYGYKINIALSTVLKIIGYLLMGYCIVIAEALGGAPLSELRPLEADMTYEVFFAGAMFLATGTAIFKPGVQGLIANQMPKESASFGWGVFYQMVNIGGFIGPMLAGYLRVLDWEYVFLACSAGIALNFVPLVFFEEPTRPPGDKPKPLAILDDAMRGLIEPRLFFFTISFAGFWLMFYQLFDILPNFIDDWIDSRAVATMLQGIVGEGTVPTVNGGNLTQEWMLNFNALLISFLAFAFGYLTGKVRPLTAIVIGIGISALAIYGLGMSMNGYWVLGAIGLFSIGEMSASPTKMRYLASIAPPGKDGLYMGYVNFTVGIGWSIGSLVAGNLYQEGGDKIELAKKYLVEEGGVAADQVADLDRGAVMEFFYQHVGVDPWGARELLWETYEPYSMWMLFMAIGIGSLLMLVAYDRVTTAAARNPEHSFNTRGAVWVRSALVPVILAFVYANVLEWSLALIVLMMMFTAMFIYTFVPERPMAEAPGGDEGEVAGDGD